jgi:hypothetical protein
MGCGHYVSKGSVNKLLALFRNDSSPRLLKCIFWISWCRSKNQNRNSNGCKKISNFCQFLDLLSWKMLSHLRSVLSWKFKIWSSKCLIKTLLKNKKLGKQSVKRGLLWHSWLNFYINCKALRGFILLHQVRNQWRVYFHQNWER